MPKTPEQNQQIKDERRANILNTALRLFALYGYDLIVIIDITREANCSHGLFFLYFKNKVDLFLELKKIAEERAFRKRREEQSLKKKPAIDAIRTIVSHMIDEIYGDNESIYILYMFVNIHLQKTSPLPP